MGYCSVARLIKILKFLIECFYFPIFQEYRIKTMTKTTKNLTGKKRSYIQKHSHFNSNTFKSLYFRWYGGADVLWNCGTCGKSPSVMMAVYRFDSNRQHLFQGRSFISQLHNANPHTASITTGWLCSRRVRVFHTLHHYGIEDTGLLSS